MQRDTDLPNGRATLGRLAHDAAAGANLALTMLPKAMAYAVVAGVPPVYGLYASCAAPALAVAFGSNRLLFTGPVGVMTVLVLGSLHHFAQPFSHAYIELAASLTLMVGVLALLFAAARLGFLVRAIPTPVIEGFIAAVGPERGILAGVAAAWLSYLCRTRRVPVHERLWQPAGASEQSAPVCLVLRPCSSFLYPNAEAIHDEALRLALVRGLPVVLDLSAAPFLDADGAEAIRDLAAACGAAGLPVVFAGAASSVLQKLKAAGVAVAGLAFPTVDEACANAVAKWKPAAPPAPAG